MEGTVFVPVKEGVSALYCLDTKWIQSTAAVSLPNRKKQKPGSFLADLYLTAHGD